MMPPYGWRIVSTDRVPSGRLRLPFPPAETYAADPKSLEPWRNRLVGASWLPRLPSRLLDPPFPQLARVATSLALLRTARALGRQQPSRPRRLARESRAVAWRSRRLGAAS